MNTVHSKILSPLAAEKELRYLVSARSDVDYRSDRGIKISERISAIEDHPWDGDTCRRLACIQLEYGPADKLLRAGGADMSHLMIGLEESWGSRRSSCHRYHLDSLGSVLQNLRYIPIVRDLPLDRRSDEKRQLPYLLHPHVFRHSRHLPAGFSRPMAAAFYLLWYLQPQLYPVHENVSRETPCRRASPPKPAVISRMFPDQESRQRVVNLCVGTIAESGDPMLIPKSLQMIAAFSDDHS